MKKINLQTFGEFIRIRQWVKNFFVIAPLIFSRSFLDPQKIEASVYAFFMFSLASSAVYILNDIVDVPHDRLHPLKRERPLARGVVSLLFAGITVSLLAAAVLILSFVFSKYFFAVLSVYFALNILYIFWVKYVALLDMFSVSLGFVLRVAGGIVAISVFVTPWILGATFFLALFIVSGKRFLGLRFTAAENDCQPLNGFYTQEFLKQIMFASLLITLLVFILYAFLEVRSLTFLISILPVTYGLFRFLYLVEAKEILTDNPTDIIFQDTKLQIAIAVFIILTVTIFTLPLTNYAFLSYFY